LNQINVPAGVRGGLLCSRSVLSYCIRRDWNPRGWKDQSDTYGEKKRKRNATPVLFELNVFTVKRDHLPRWALDKREGFENIKDFFSLSADEVLCYILMAAGVTKRN
jgi:hypothetical protein